MLATIFFIGLFVTLIAYFLKPSFISERIYNGTLTISGTIGIILFIIFSIA